MKNTPFTSFLTLLLLTVAGCAFHLLSGSEPPKVAPTPPAIGLDVRDDVKVVYHIKVGALDPDGVGKGVAELRHLVRIYDEQGVTRKKRDIHAVFDADGVPFVLNDKAYSRFGQGDINANAPFIAQLIEEGVAVEVCGQRMARDALTGEALLPGVTIVLGGQMRVIDLQLRGYAYFRF